MRLPLLILLCVSSGCGGDHEVSSLSEAAKVVCAAGPTVTGIDVSNYQGKVDWVKVAASGRKFAIAKATEGTGFVDASFATNWPAMAKAGLIRGAYHFFRPNVDPVAQAKHFVNTMGPLGPDDLPPMFDLEVTDGQSDATVVSTAKTFIQTVEKLTGKKPILYTYVDFFQNQIGAPAGFTGYPLNIANYGVTCPTVVGTWTTWTMWQYSSTGSIPGISGNVDEDRFNGDLAALKKLAAGTSGGTANPCIGLVDGTYCGGDGLAGDKNTLYVCAGGQVSSMTACAGGCKYNPPGTPDACNPAPPPTGGEDGGAATTGGGGGGGGGEDADGGTAGGGNAEVPGTTGSGCALAGAPASDATTALALIALLALALRRRTA